MISRKSNIAGANWPLETPRFRLLAWIDQPGNRRLAFVALGRDHEDFSQLIHRDVIIDGEKHLCLEIQTFAPRSARKGDTIGIVVSRN